MCIDKFKRLFLSIFFLFSLNAYSLPIDWHGTFGVDSTSIDQYRRLNQKSDSSTIGTGSQEIPLASGEHHRASWQSYIFKLSPEIVVNDSASFKGEIANGYARSGRLGDNPYKSREGVTHNGNNQGGTTTFGNSLYYYNNSFPGTDQKLLLNKFYMELYSDTATYLIGRHSSHWGMGAVVNEGSGRWDRHSSTRDGITMKLKIGNFSFEPYWAKMDSVETLTRATNSRHWGIGILYDNVDRDIAFGLLYSIMKIAKSNTNQSYDMGTAGSIGESNIKLLDLYFKKVFGKLTLEAEAPIFGGEMGPIYGSGEIKYKAKAILLSSKYQLNKSWKIGLNAGSVSGDEGGQSSFEAMYLHPNFQIANLLFKFNRRAISSPNSRSVYDSYVTNTQYLKLSGTYDTDKWAIESALIYAKANQVAQQGSGAFNHLTNKTFTATSTQDKDQGMELDFNFKYKWNTEVLIDGGIGYLFTGDYFGFNDTTTPLETKNSYVLQLRASLDF